MEDSRLDQRDGKTLWQFPTNVRMKASPITFTVRGNQYVGMAAGPNIFCFGLWRPKSFVRPIAHRAYSRIKAEFRGVCSVLMRLSSEQNAPEASRVKACLFQIRITPVA
jgi:hypothetical protein